MGSPALDGELVPRVRPTRRQLALARDERVALGIRARLVRPIALGVCRSRRRERERKKKRKKDREALFKKVADQKQQK